MKQDPKRKYQIVDTTSSNTASSTVRLLVTAFLSIIRRPHRFMSQLTSRNIRILAKALQNESKNQIISNLIRLLSSKTTSKSASTILSLDEQYQQLLNKQKFTQSDLEKLKESALKLKYKPLISVVIPVFKPDLANLNACLQSIEEQIYESWQVCIHDDGSDKEVQNTLSQWNQKDDRFQYTSGDRHLHISGASNKALANCNGDFVAFVDQDDLLSVDALYRIVEALHLDREIDIVYSDHDKISPSGQYILPYFKSDYNPDLILCHNYIGHLLVVRRTLGQEIGWFREGYEGAQDYDLILRLIRRTDRIHHIARVLYHWRQSPQSTAASIDFKPYAVRATRLALEEHLNSSGIKGEVLEAKPPNTFRVKREVSQEHLVSIIIPFADKPLLLLRCIESIRKHDHYRKFEVILLSNNSVLRETLDLIDKVTAEDSRFHLARYDVPFNYSKINNWAASKAKGKYLLFLNNDTEVLHDQWLTNMVEHITRPEVGAVGAKLLYPERTIQHAGVIIGVGGTAAHAFKGFPEGNFGYYGRAALQQNLSAVTGACMLVKRSIFQELEGFDETNLKVSFSDIDLCLRIREAGFLVVFTPYTVLIHHESKTRGADPLIPGSRAYEEVKYFQQRWSKILHEGDPYYNLNLSRNSTDFSLRME